jgi:hypothetical protein
VAGTSRFPTEAVAGRLAGLQNTRLIVLKAFRATRCSDGGNSRGQPRSQGGHAVVFHVEHSAMDDLSATKYQELTLLGSAGKLIFDHPRLVEHHRSRTERG